MNEVADGYADMMERRPWDGPTINDYPLDDGGLVVFDHGCRTHEELLVDIIQLALDCGWQGAGPSDIPGDLHPTSQGLNRPVPPGRGLAG